MLFEEHVFRQTSGSGFSVLEEIQISPDGTRLCAAHNNLGGAIFSFSGTIIQFLLNENHEPSFLGILATSSTFASFITHLDFSSGSNKVFFVQQPYNPSNPKLNFQDVFGNSPTTFLSETRSAVRRLNDGYLYFKLPNGTNGYLAKIVGANGQSPGLSNQLIIDLPPAYSSLMTLIPHFTTQPHRLYPHKGVHPRVVGEKLYELTDHLGNVRTTITDRKIATFDSNWLITGYTADIKSANDYFPFGSEMPGRSYNSGDYRFGFNGMEKDDEVKGTGNSYDYGARIYDSRIGRFLSVDPSISSFPELSPFLYANNSPIYFVDAEGKSGKAYKTNQVNERTGNPILKVVSNIYVFGEGATAARVEAMKSELNTQYNRGGNYFTYTDDAGKTYDVSFEFSVKKVGLGDALDGIRAEKVENNYFLVDEDHDVSYTVNGKEPFVGGNTGYISTEQFDKGNGNLAHEMNHGYGGENHSVSPRANDGSVVDISTFDGEKYDDGTSIDISGRSVTQGNIDDIFKHVKFDTNGQGNVGNPRRQAAVGCEQVMDVVKYK